MIIYITEKRQFLALAFTLISIVRQHETVKYCVVFLYKNETNSTFVGKGFIPFRYILYLYHVILNHHLCGRGQAPSLQ